VQDNVVDGDGSYALQVSTFGLPPIGTASFNGFIENQIDSFTPSVADIFLDANSANNVVIGECTSVLDLGVNNSVRCSGENAHSADPHTALSATSSALAVKSSLQRLLLNGSVNLRWIQ
jgi:hypothetical protein